MADTLYWKRDAVSPELEAALEALGEEYALTEGEGAPSLEFVPGAEAGSVECSRLVLRSGPLRRVVERDAFRISYSSLAGALRGLGAALAGLPAALRRAQDGGTEPVEGPAEGENLSEKCPFTTLGIMLDCSRNAVMRVDHVKRWMRRLALLGYNMVMLYTEDTYELPGEPLFGAFRGRYTRDELKEMDAYAARLGIELVGCIQTLGHLEQILKWGAYKAVQDTRSVLLVDEPATEKLIGKMIDTYASCLRTRRIHVGMDEAHDLGRGRFMDLRGYEPGFDIMNRHLALVIDICKERGMHPMIWSDMYFRLGSKTGGYYDLESRVPEDARKAIPTDVSLVYWDYYHDDEEFYLKMIERHRELGHVPVMGSGVWTWGHLWYQRAVTEKSVRPCVRACREAGLKDLFFTLWGDDGGYCEFDSGLAGLAFAAELAWGSKEGPALARRYEAACGIAYDTTLLGSKLSDHTLCGRLQGDTFRSEGLLWDDPLVGLYWLSLKDTRDGFWESALECCGQIADELGPHQGVTEPVDMDHALTLARFLAAKIDFRLRLDAAYEKRDLKALSKLAGEAERMAGMTEELGSTFRRQWYRRNKPFGFEVIQIRLGGQRERFLETGRRLEDLAQGKTEAIPELEEGLRIPKDARRHLGHSKYRSLGTASCIL